MQDNYADVIVDISHEKVDRPFQYRIPESLAGSLEVGACVTVPFGAGNKLLQGYVIGISGKAEYDPAKTKEIHSVLEGSVSVEEKMIRLAAWIKDHYGATMIQALKAVLPARKSIKTLEKKSVRLLLSVEDAGKLLEECERKHHYAKARLLEELCRMQELPYGLVTTKLNVSSPTIKSLEKQGVLEVITQSLYRNPVKLELEKSFGQPLSEAQGQIVKEVLADFDCGQKGTYLIHGITGSGKTEVYMSLIEEVVKRGKQAIVLIPEIALTYQTVVRFYRRFGDRVSVMNSTLSPGEKYDQCERAKKREIDVIIGPRSALFTPFPDIGLIVMDEEHESSYKSESSPKYHARETAEEVARLHGASLILGSATPSLEAYSRVKQGEYRLFELTERLTGGCLPEVYVVDLREELKAGNRSIFSKKLQELMEQRLVAGEQFMLFLNRRGYAGFISCRACGHVMKCPHCDVSLSEHKNGRLICHYCGHQEQGVKLCPACGSKYISGFRAGTQQIEERLRQMYPQARILRMDADTTRKKESYEKILSAFANKEADVLIGTQMIVKGHDFPNVTLVGILAADMSLSVNDYRAGERTFQLLTQAAGRAGRGEKPGEVVIQTYQPEHYSIVHAAKQDYKAFYEEEILYRELLRYPPVTHMVAVQIMGRNEESTSLLASKLAETAGKESFQKAILTTAGSELTHEGAEEKPLLVIGPAPASVGKINDIFRFVFYIKHENYDKLMKIKDSIEARVQELQPMNEIVQFDFNPINTF